jgi:hypothetical protein
MFPSQDQQWNLTSGRRIREAAAEYQRSRDFDGAHAMPDYIEFLRVLAVESSTADELRVAYDRYRKSFGPRARSSAAADLGPLLGDRAALRARIRRAVEQREPFHELAYGIADALGEAEIALESISAFLDSPDNRTYDKYWELWTMPYSKVRTLPGFKDLLRAGGIADYWRATGKWGDFCKPVSDTDFECH